MHMILEKIACLAIGYVCGMFLTANLAAKIKTGKSAYEIGSGNPGMANVMSNVSFSAGVFTLAGDILKVVLAAVICYFLFPDLTPARLNFLYSGVGTCLGHNFPIYHPTKGGKGVTTTCSTIVLYQPIPGLIADVVGMLVVFKTGLLPVGAVIIPLVFTPYAFYKGGVEAGIISLLLTVMMFFRHRNGLKRTKEGTEQRHAKLFGK